MSAIELDSGELIIFCMALITVGSIALYLKGRHQPNDRTPKGVKQTSKDGQVDFVENLKDSATEALTFLKEENTSLKSTIKSLRGQVAKLQGLLYGTTDPEEIAAQIAEANSPQKSGKGNKNGTVSEDVINMRLSLMAQKLKIPPMLLNFQVVKDALYDIAADPNFDQIAAAALSSGDTNQSTALQKDLNYV